jgi:hypothetical protein
MKSTVFWDIMPGLQAVISHNIVLLFTISLLTASLFRPVNGGILMNGTITRFEIFMAILMQFKIYCASLDKTVLHPRKLQSTTRGIRFGMIQAKYLMGYALTPIHQSSDIYGRQTMGKTISMSTKE